MNRVFFEKILKDAGFILDSKVIGQFQNYEETLLDWNTRMNLTAIKEPDEIAVKHFLDSLLLLKGVEIPSGEAAIDVGTGAGFPGIPLKLARPDIRLTLLDSLNKRVVFLKELCIGLGIEAETVHSRGEEAGRKPGYRERYFLATARAVSNLRDLTEYCLPFVKPGGIFAAMKGFEVEGELKEAERAIKLLGGRVEEVKKYALPDGSRRSLVLIKKISQTPTNYPRPSAKIAKSPL